MDEGKKLALIMLGFQNPSTKHNTCVTLDVMSLIQDTEMSFNPGQNKQLLGILLEDIFNKAELCKIGHAMSEGVVALKHQLGVKSINMLDMQIAYEVFTGKSTKASKSDLYELCGLENSTKPFKTGTLDIDTNKEQNSESYKTASSEIGDTEMLRSAFSDRISKTQIDQIPKTHTFLHSINIFFQMFASCENNQVKEMNGLTFKQRLKIVQKATESRIQRHAENITSGQKRDPRVSSTTLSDEVLEQIEANKVGLSKKIVIYEETSSIMDLIPFKFRDKLSSDYSILTEATQNSDNENLSQLRDIVMEVGQRPYAYFGKQKREWICKDEHFRIGINDIELLTNPLIDRFGPNNRAVLDGSLHRISCMRSKTNQIYSLTYRIGRAVMGLSNIIEDILCGPSSKSVIKPSILILGYPGTGKTTVIRDITNALSSQMFNVIVVDTSNEICGDGLVLHFSVGMARRMMVPKIEDQAQILIEAVQNHTPDVVVCDEIGRFSEVKATKTVKERGVRCIGSAHGNLRSLVENPELNGLVGGIDDVTLGDKEATDYMIKNDKKVFSKTVKQRVGSPLFDVIIELDPGTLNEWTIVKDVGSAVDKILVGEKYPAEIRRRNPETDFFTREEITC